MDPKVHTPIRPLDNPVAKGTWYFDAPIIKTTIGTAYSGLRLNSGNVSVANLRNTRGVIVSEKHFREAQTRLLGVGLQHFTGRRK